MKIITWNVNGVRSLLKNFDLNAFLKHHDPDIFCMSELKLSCPFVETENLLKKEIDILNYRYWNVCVSKGGYSGVSIWSKNKPINVTLGFKKEHDDEGRIITAEFEDFYIVQCYIPNSGVELKRLEYRTKNFDVDFRKYLKKLSKNKSLIVCGDLNVAHNEIDIYNPKKHLKSPGFTIEERNNFGILLKEIDLVDSFRYLYPTKIEYSFWSNFGKSKEKNHGWRLDYFLISNKITDKLINSSIITEYKGSDHAPILLELKN